MSWSDDYLEHHGILGQKWGVRRFQNPDGSLTEKGKNAAVGSYGNTSLKNVYTYKNGQKTQAVLSDVMKQAMYELDNDWSYERRFN